MSSLERSSTRDQIDALQRQQQQLLRRDGDGASPETETSHRENLNIPPVPGVDELLGVNSQDYSSVSFGSGGSEHIESVRDERSRAVDAVVDIVSRQGSLQKVEMIDNIVKLCTRESVWPVVKFLTEGAVNEISRKVRTGWKNGILGMLLKRAGRENLDFVGRFHFWMVYSPTVEREIKNMRSGLAKALRDNLYKGNAMIELDVFGVLVFV